jgi:hypothetical protein
MLSHRTPAPQAVAQAAGSAGGRFKTFAISRPRACTARAASDPAKHLFSLTFDVSVVFRSSFAFWASPKRAPGETRGLRGALHAEAVREDK